MMLANELHVSNGHDLVQHTLRFVHDPFDVYELEFEILLLKICIVWANWNLEFGILISFAQKPMIGVAENFFEANNDSSIVTNVDK